MPGEHDIAASAVLAAYGARIRTSGDDGAVRAVLSLVGPALTIAGLPGDAVDAGVTVTLPAPPSPGVVCRDGEVVAQDSDSAELVRRALSELHLAVAVHAREGVFVHAGAVAWRGLGIVVPGRSMSGKTTLVRALVEAGADYYSDEYAVLGPDGWLHPYAKPLSIRVPGSVSEMLPPESVGSVGTSRVPVGLVVSTRHQHDAAWAPERIGGAAATLSLVDNTVVARLEPERMLEATTAAAARAVCVSGPRPDAGQTAAQLLEMADRIADQCVS